MRVIGEISHSHCKITIFSWNNRYLVKLEQGHLEQTYKIEQYDIASESDLSKIIDENFIQEALKLFESMAKSLHIALEKV